MARDYQLHQSQTFQGLWWHVDAPEDRVAGDLVFSPESGSKLTLIGAFGDVMTTMQRIMGQAPATTLHGMSVDGKAISLLGAVSAASQLNFPGIPVESYMIPWVLVGAHVRDVEDKVFTKSAARFEGLDQWLARQVLHTALADEPRWVTITATTLPAWSLGRVADDFEVVADTSVNWQEDQLTRSELTARSSLGLRSTKPRGLGWHVDRLARLNRLVALCTGRHLQFSEIWLEAGEEEIAAGKTRPVRVDILIQLTETPSGRRFNDPPVYSAKELVDANSEAMARWFQVAEQLEPVIDLFFTVLGTPGLPLEAAFLLIVQAIEVHHRRTEETSLMSKSEFKPLRAALVDAIPGSTPVSMREKLTSMLAFANEPSLLQRLRAIVERLGDAFGPSPFGFDEDTVRKAVDTRNYYTHYSAHLTTRALSGAPLHAVIERFKPMLFTLLLAELALPLDDIALHLERRRDLNPKGRR